ncbi:MAG: hypothetical protein HS115_12305 [Spirochaetales bacterium]|nr:hypothetical protein [Spirochaetales bacterium]
MMMGGNDIKNRADLIKIPILGTLINQREAHEIHGHIRKVVHHLSIWRGKDVIVQRHFKVNPSVGWQRLHIPAPLMLAAGLPPVNVDASFNLSRYQFYNETFDALNGYAWEEFGEGEPIRLIPPRLYIKEWVSTCRIVTLGFCPFCIKNIRLCWKQPIFAWTGWQIYFVPKTPRTSFAQLPDTMPYEFFADAVHLNGLGCQVHSYYLARALRQRCWW